MYNVDSDECEADCENHGQSQRALRVDDYLSSNYMNNVVHDLEESQWDVSESRSYHLDSEAWNANDNIETPLAANMYRNNALDFENQQQEPKMQSTVLLLFIKYAKLEACLSLAFINKSFALAPQTATTNQLQTL